MDLRPIYYVYRYIRLDTNTPFYCGKGFGKRATAFKQHSKKCQAIIAHAGVEVEYIMENMPEKESFAKEMEFIKLYKSYGWCEANETLGGEGSSGFKHSQKAKDKISKANTGRKHSPETRAQMCRDRKGRKGTPHTENTKKKLAKQHTGLKASKQTKERMAKSHGGKPFEVWTASEFKLVGIWNTITECSRDLKLWEEAISAALHKRQRRTGTGGYIFRYVDDKTSLERIHHPHTKEEIGRNISKATRGLKRSDITKERISQATKRQFAEKGNPFAKKVIDLTTGKIWKSAKEAALELGYIPSSLCNWLNGTNPNKTTLRYLKDTEKSRR